MLHIYLIPGMSAGQESFEALTVPQNCSTSVIPWVIPEPKEDLLTYTKRMLVPINPELPFVLVGVSFGGIIAQEALKIIKPKMVVLISTVKSHREKPNWMRWVYAARLHKLMPYYFAEYLTHKPPRVLPSYWQKRWEQYDYYLPMRDHQYLAWGVDQVLKWKGTEFIKGLPVVHIHGDRDHLFPIKYIKGATAVQGGPHVMILTHGKIVGNLLARIIQGF